MEADMNKKNMVYMTVLTNDKYIRGVKALKLSLRKVKSQHNLIILVPESKKNELDFLLKKYKVLDENCKLYIQEDLNVEYPEGVNFEKHYWSDTFFKLSAANCTEYDKLILLDSDMLITKNIDHLFDWPSYSAVVSGKCASPEWVKFNSGLMVIEPSTKLFTTLLVSIKPAMYRRFNEGNNIGDQDVFQEAFADWKNHNELLLPEIYNCFFKNVRLLKNTEHIKLNDIAVIHFIGPEKPWSYGCFTKQNIMQCMSFIKHFKFYELKIYIRYLILSYL